MNSVENNWKIILLANELPEYYKKLYNSDTKLYNTIINLINKKYNNFMLNKNNFINYFNYVIQIAEKIRHNAKNNTFHSFDIIFDINKKKISDIVFTTKMVKPNKPNKPIKQNLIIERDDFNISNFIIKKRDNSTGILKDITSSVKSINESEKDDFNISDLKIKKDDSINNILKDTTSSVKPINESEKTPEDSRLFSYNNTVYLLYNRVKQNKRLMYLYDMNKNEEIELCSLISSNFEKNWGLFIHNNMKHIVYSVDPLKVYNIDGNYQCNLENSIEYINIFEQIKKTFHDNNNIHVHFRNSSKLIPKDGFYYGLGHCVFDTKEVGGLKNLIDSSHPDYDFFKNYPKLYLGFIYVLSVNGNNFKIEKISDLFQITKQKELINFFSDLEIINDKFVICHGIGDVEAHITEIPFSDINFRSSDDNKISFLKYDITKFKNIELTNSIRNLFSEIGFKTNTDKKINVTNPGILLFNNKLYITTRILFGNIREWTGKNYILTGELDNTDIINDKLIYFDKDTKIISNFGSVVDYKNKFINVDDKISGHIKPNVQELIFLFKTSEPGTLPLNRYYYELISAITPKIPDATKSRILVPVILNSLSENGFLIPTSWLRIDQTLSDDVKQNIIEIINILKTDNEFNKYAFYLLTNTIDNKSYELIDTDMAYADNIYGLINSFNFKDYKLDKYYKKYLKYKQKYIDLKNNSHN